MDSHYKVHIRENLKRLITVHASSIAVCEEMLAVLQTELDAASSPLGNTNLTQSPKRTGDGPFIDRTLLSVTHRGKSCFLGNTLALRLLERLLHRPNQYVSYEQLQDDVWNAVRSPAAIRSVVKELRTKLKLAGMQVLAAAIDGRAARHYRLSLNVMIRAPHRLPTASPHDFTQGRYTISSACEPTPVSGPKFLPHLS